MVKSIQISLNKLNSSLKDLDGKSCKLLLYLASKANEEDLVEITNSKVQKELGISKNVFNASINSLKKEGFIRTIAPLKNGLGYLYRISSSDDDILFDIQERLF